MSADVYLRSNPPHNAADVVLGLSSADVPVHRLGGFGGQWYRWQPNIVPYKRPKKQRLDDELLLLLD